MKELKDEKLDEITLEFEPIERRKNFSKIFYGLFFVILLVSFIYWFHFREPDISKMEKSLAIKVCEDEEAAEIFSGGLESDGGGVENFDRKESKIVEMVIESEATGSYYIVVGSFIDLDLAKDFGFKLVKKGVLCYLIPSKVRFGYNYLAISKFSSRVDAVDFVKSKAYSFSKVWIKKY